jgi:hypothetical protein
VPIYSQRRDLRKRRGRLSFKEPEKKKANSRKISSENPLKSRGTRQGGSRVGKREDIGE